MSKFLKVLAKQPNRRQVESIYVQCYTEYNYTQIRQIDLLQSSPP